MRIENYRVANATNKIPPPREGVSAKQTGVERGQKLKCLLNILVFIKYYDFAVPLPTSLTLGHLPFAVPDVRLAANGCVAHRPRHTLRLRCISHWQRSGSKPPGGRYYARYLPCHRHHHSERPGCPGRQFVTKANQYFTSAIMLGIFLASLIRTARDFSSDRSMPADDVLCVLRGWLSGEPGGKDPLKKRPTFAGWSFLLLTYRRVPCQVQGDQLRPGTPAVARDLPGRRSRLRSYR